MFSSCFDNLFDAGLFAEGPQLADELNLHTVLRSDAFRVRQDVLLKRFVEVGVHEYFDLTGIQECRHSLIVASTGKRSLQNHAVIAG